MTEPVILILLVAALAVGLACLILTILHLVKLSHLDPAKLTDSVADEVTQRESVALSSLKLDLVNENRASRIESNELVQSTMKLYSEAQTTAVNQQFRTFAEQNSASLDAIRATVQGQLETIQKDNHAQLDQMRRTVDEKLQKT